MPEHVIERAPFNLSIISLIFFQYFFNISIILVNKIYDSSIQYLRVLKILYDKDTNVLRYIFISLLYSILKP